MGLHFLRQRLFPPDEVLRAVGKNACASACSQLQWSWLALAIVIFKDDSSPLTISLSLTFFFLVYGVYGILHNLTACSHRTQPMSPRPSHLIISFIEIFATLPGKQSRRGTF